GCGDRPRASASCRPVHPRALSFFCRHLVDVGIPLCPVRGGVCPAHQRPVRFPSGADRAAGHRPDADDGHDQHISRPRPHSDQQHLLHAHARDVCGRPHLLGIALHAHYLSGAARRSLRLCPWQAQPRREPHRRHPNPHLPRRCHPHRRR
ncbi:hypothetical protein H632_c5032p0, partial [Helicosporidium sp. ATCC 50920]